MPEIVEAVEAKWDSKPSRKRLIWFFLRFEHLLPENSNTKLAII